MSFKVVYSAVFCALVVGAHSAALLRDSTDHRGHATYLPSVNYGELPDDGAYYEYTQPVAVLKPVKRQHERHRRQVSTTISGDSNGNTDYLVRANDKHQLSAGVLAAASITNPTVVTGAGLAYDNAAGHDTSLMDQYIPSLGAQLTADANLNLVNEDKQNMDEPTLETNSGSLDYLNNNNVGASVGMSHADLIKATISGMGKLNLFLSPVMDMSLDLAAGLSSPFMPSTAWQPVARLLFPNPW